MRGEYIMERTKIKKITEPINDLDEKGQAHYCA